MKQKNTFYSISLNPSLDNSFYLTTEFLYDDINRIKETYLDAGGKGLNVARMLTNLNCKCVALTFLGGDKGKILKSLLSKKGVKHISINTKEEVRNVYNFFAKEKVLRFNEAGPKISSTEKKDFLSLIDKLNYKKGDIISISGSLPPGVDKNFYEQIIKKVKKRGFYISLDTDGEPLKYGVRASPDVIKPNLWELERMLGYKINSPKMLYDTLKNLIQKSVSIVLLSLGRKGAILFSKDNLFYVSVPKIKVESSVGCGDAFLAGFLYQFSLGNSQEESLKFAAASGTAKAMLKGTLMPNEREIYKVLAQIKTQKLNLEDPASFSFLSL